ncbi:CU044_2847 family protein [Streptomyces globisporus]|uniref:CU044_2847 family protein n=1 Tax=Streptomyces globisporus TaxID=1908 RepID=UPI0036FD639B
MSQLVQLTMPDDQIVWALVERPNGPQDSGLGDVMAARLEGFQDALRTVVSNVQAAVAVARPEEISVEFGLELAAGKHGVVAAVTGVGGKATFKVALKWRGDTGPATPPPPITPPAAQGLPPAPDAPAAPDAPSGP